MINSIIQSIKELDAWQCVLAILTTFVSTFFHGLQSINVSQGERRAAALTGYCMYLADAVLIGLVAGAGFAIAPISAVGAAVGYWFSIKAHKRVTRTKRRARKLSDKLKLQRRIHKVLEKERANW